MKKIVREVGLFLLVAVGIAVAANFVFGQELKQMPNTDVPAEALSKIFPPGKPSPGDGLSKIDAPKFFFGVGIAAMLIGGVIKLAIVVVIGLFVFYFFRHRKVDRGDPNKDFVDTLVSAFTDTVNKVKEERAKRIGEVGKIDTALAKLRKGVAKAVKS